MHPAKITADIGEIFWHLAIGLDNGHIKLYDEKTLQVTSLLKRSLSPSKVDGHTDRVFCIANHPFNPHEFVSSGWDNT